MKLLKKHNNDSLYSELTSVKILGLKFLGKFKEAYETADSLINFLNSKKKLEKYLPNAYQIKSRVEIDLGNHKNAILSAKEALKLNANTSEDRKAALLNIIGVAYYFKEELDSTLYYYNASYTIKKAIKADDYQLAITTYNIGIVEEVLGNYDQAIKFYKRASNHDLNDQGEEVGFLSDIYVALANTYFKKSDLEKAEEYAEKALQVALKRYGEDNPNTSFVYSSYSNILELKGDYEKSKEFIKKALNIRRKTYGKNHRWTAESLLSIAEMQEKLKDYNEAIKNYNEAVRIAKLNNNALLKAYAKRGLASVYIKTAQLDSVKSILENSKLEFEKIYGKYHETHLSTLILEAEYYIKLNNARKALKIIKEVENSTKDARLFYQLDAKLLKLEIGFEKFANSSITDILEEELKDIEASINLMDNIKKDYPTNASKIYVNGIMRSFIAKAIEASYLLYTKTQEHSYIEKAFKLSELSKSNALVSGIRDIKFKKMIGVPAHVLKLENKLNTTLSKLKQDVYYEEQTEKPDINYINEALTQQLQKRQVLDSLLLVVKENYPKYYQLKYSVKPITISALQTDILKLDQTLIEYFVSSDFVFVFTIEKSKIQFKKLEKSKIIIDKIIAYRSLLDEQKSLTTSAEQLFNTLLKPLNLKAKQLIIVPDAELNHLPFETLMSNGKFLIENYVVSYSGSASLLEIQQDNFSDFNYTSNWSGFAPSYSYYKSLTANETEIKTISKLMNGNCFLGKDASVSNFEKQAKTSAIIHLATHAKLDKNNPLYSRLVFSKDSVVTASDIYTLPIKAELAVLSACETGFGKLEKGEGVMSLSRAFQYAGAKSTVMSLWKVPDKETSKLMFLFYDNLKRGLPKDEALQQAKVNYLKTTDDVLLMHPFYWSGLVISGDVSPIQTSKTFWWYVMIAILGLLVFFLLRKLLSKRFK